MTLLQLTNFCTIVKHMNFNKAAKELHVSQPTLSNSIASLEKELGLFLFERKGHHIELTKYGTYYYDNIHEALQKLDTATADVKKLANAVTGHIDIAYNPPFAQGFVPHHVYKFLDLEKDNKITVQFEQLSSTKIVAGIQDGRYDVGFLTMVPDIPGMTFVPLQRQEMVAIVPSTHRLAGKSSICLAELNSYFFVAYIKEAGLRRIVDNYLNQAKIVPHIVALAPDEIGIAGLVAANVGVSLVAKVPMLESANVVSLPIKDFDCFRLLYMMYDSNRYLTPAVQRLISYMKKQAEEF